MKVSNYIKTVLHPAWYHGDLFKPPFFEGWYFKVVNPDQSQAYAFIPGVYVDPDPKKSHAFIQVLEGNTGMVHEEQFPISAFSWTSAPFEIQIGKNRFSLTGISLDITAIDYHLTGTLEFGRMNPWKVAPLSPGIMGWFGWLPFMECYHGLLGFDHSVTGNLTVDGQVIDFEHGRGYIEKDWGKAFPSSWIWTQSNHFQQSEVSLSASVAVIPFLGMKFTGVIVGLWVSGKLHRFATYNGARVKQIDVAERHLELTIQKGKETLRLQAERGSGGILAAPTLNGMDRRIAESLQGRVSVELYNGKELIFCGTGERAGLEIVGDIEELRHLA